MRRLARLLPLLAVALAAPAMELGILATASTTTPLEAAKQALSSDRAAVASVKSALTSAEAAEASQVKVIAALEGEAPKEATATVNATPTGPTGQFSAVYADGFAAPLGTGSGQDDTWTAESHTQGCCGNSNEIAVERPSMASVTSEGLKLSCEYVPATIEGRYYGCAGVTNHRISYELGRGATFVFETVARLPYNTGEMDPGWWSVSNTRWPPELDFFEEWGWGSCYSPSAGTNVEANKACVAGMPVYKSSGLGGREAYAGLYAKTPPGDPSAGFHRYTTLVSGPASNARFEAYVDGVREGSFEHAVNTDGMNLILTSAMREPRCFEGSMPDVRSCYFQSGSRSFTIRSVAVYEDAAHAGEFISGGGVAPGTVVG